MNTKGFAWMFYLLGAALTLLWKMVRYVHEEKKKGRRAKDAIAQWFLEDSIENTTSWCVTIGLVWTLGAIYISLRDNAGIFNWISVIPLHNALAFSLGGLMELIAPEVAKNIMGWLVSKFPKA